MNERIKKLCEQSKEYADKSTKDFTGDEPVCWMDYYTEKLAELIVKECIAVLNPEGDLISMREEYGRVTSMKMIKKHFGVEE